MKTVVFVTSGLGTGGAETMLLNVLRRLHGVSIDAKVVSLAPRAAMSDAIEKVGIQLEHLGLRSAWQLPLALPRLSNIMRRFAPDVLQGWMYHGNLGAAIALRIATPASRLVFGIRHSLDDLARDKRSTRVAIRLGACASRYADAVVYNSHASRQQHEAIGYVPTKSKVIDNGFDTDLFRPDDEAYRAVRAELRLQPQTSLVGMIARWHPVKDHETFLRAAATLAAIRTDVHFLLAGKGVERDNPALQKWMRREDLRGRLHLLGERRDIARLTAALDVAALSSRAEAFPNVVGEASSCGVPCVAADVGDVRRVLGPHGMVVEPGDARAFADAWLRLLELPHAMRLAMGLAARARMVERFSMQRVASEYAALYARD